VKISKKRTCTILRACAADLLFFGFEGQGSMKKRCRENTKKEVFLRVQGWLLTLKNERKMGTFQKVKIVDFHCTYHAFGDFGCSQIDEKRIGKSMFFYWKMHRKKEGPKSRKRATSGGHGTLLDTNRRAPGVPGRDKIKDTTKNKVEADYLTTPLGRRPGEFHMFSEQ